MGDQEISMDRRNLQALLKTVTPRLPDAQSQQEYLQAMTCTKTAADRALALQQFAAGAGESQGQSALAAAEAELTSLGDDLCATPPRLLPPLQYWPSWWWPWPWPPPQSDQEARTDQAQQLPAVVLLACGAQLQDIADLVQTHARHEPFAVHARHEPFIVTARRLLDAGLAALSHPGS
jgi:hypothetical protein